MAKFDLKHLTQQLNVALGKERCTEKILATLELAYESHQGQFRETRDNTLPRPPYILHPLGVAILAHKYFDKNNLPDTHEDIIMAALAHDLLEDTDLTASELGRICSVRVAEIVQALTKPGVKQDETHTKRNERFLEQIACGGPSVMYLKICDSMHNLGRPAQSPPRLIKKAVRKAQKEYMTFFDKGFDSESLKFLYEDRIFETSKILQKIQIENSEKKLFPLVEAVNQAVLYSGQKILELHDIRDIFEELTGAAFSSELSKEELFDYLIPTDHSIHQKTRVTLRNKLESGKLERNDMPKSLRNGFWEGVDRVFILDTGLKGRSEAKRTYVFGYSNRFCPDWVNENTLKLIFSYLTERLRLTENTKYVALSSDAGSLGLDLLPGEIEKVCMTYSDLIELRDLLSYATYIRNIIKTELAKSIDNTHISLVTALETRIKEPRSIVAKMIARKLSSILDIDDIVGFRMVCLNTTDQKKLLKLVNDVCTSQLLATYQKDDDAWKTDTSLVQSKEGYKAHHLLFSFRAHGLHELPIRCEFQIRTVFQDAWARVSNAVLYKKYGKLNEIKQILKTLSELRDKSDGIIDQISS